MHTTDRAASAASLRPAHGYLPVLLIGAAFLFQLDRLLSLTLDKAGNILFWDQWEQYVPFFEHASVWRIFTWQLGPVRLGIGSVAAWILAGLTHWNARSEALAFVGIVAVATLLAVYLKRRLFGSLSLADVVIPLLLLSPLQYDMLVGATDLSHGAFPLLLTMLMCLAWIQPNRLIRYGLVSCANFLMIYTAFGFFMGLITPVLLALDCYGAMRAKQRGALVGGLLAFATALLSLASFFIGYAFVPGVDSFRFPYGNVLAYPWYAGLMFANSFGLKSYHHVGSSVVGIALLICVVGVLIHHVRLLLRKDAGAESISRIVTILLGYTLLFVLATAVGRVQIGAYSADSSRYYLYVTIGLLGLYFHLLTLRRAAIRVGGSSVLLLGSAVAGLHLTALDEFTMSQISNGKRAWRACYLRTEDIAGCDEATKFPICPPQDTARLKEELDYLKLHRLNLFAEDP